MKQIRYFIIYIIALFTLSAAMAQPPASFNYQAVLRDSQGQIIDSEEVSLHIAILKGSVEGEEVFSETHNSQTNEFGLVNLQIGSQTPIGEINWGSDIYFLQVSVDGTIMGTSQLLSVPYALYAREGGDNPWAEAEGDIHFQKGNVGIGTDEPSALLHTHGAGTGEGNVLFTGFYKSNAGETPHDGTGTMMMWYPDKAAFRAGRINDTYWDRDSIGEFSFATGTDPMAKGIASMASGERTIASGSYSTAMGSRTRATNTYSTAMGRDSHAAGYYSTAIGYSTVASGTTSVAMGNVTTASGAYSTAMGLSTNATESASTAMGANTVASGLRSTAMGSGTLAGGDYSTAMGRNAKATGDHSFAINLSGGTPSETPDRTFWITGALAIGGNQAWSTISDKRLKRDITSLSPEKSLEKVLQLSGIIFRWKEEDESTKLGFMAQQVLDIVPEAIRYDELNDIYSMEYTAIIPLLTEAIKEQQKMIEKLQNEIELLNPVSTRD